MRGLPESNRTGHNAKPPAPGKGTGGLFGFQPAAQEAIRGPTCTPNFADLGRPVHRSVQMHDRHKNLTTGTLTLSGVMPQPESQPASEPDAAVTEATAPQGPVRTHGRPGWARSDKPWWGVIAVEGKKRGNSYHGPIFRHPTRETAEAEATYLAALCPGQRYTVIEAVSFHLVAKPPADGGGQ